MNQPIVRLFSGMVMVLGLMLFAISILLAQSIDTVENPYPVNVTNHDIGVTELAVTVGGTPYRRIMLKSNLDENHAFIIRNAVQFNNVRQVIDQGGCCNEPCGTEISQIGTNRTGYNIIL